MMVLCEVLRITFSQFHEFVSETSENEFFPSHVADVSFLIFPNFIFSCSSHVSEFQIFFVITYFGHKFRKYNCAFLGYVRAGHRARTTRFVPQRERSWNTVCKQEKRGQIDTKNHI